MNCKKRTLEVACEPRRKYQELFDRRFWDQSPHRIAGSCERASSSCSSSQSAPQLASLSTVQNNELYMCVELNNFTFNLPLC